MTTPTPPTPPLDRAQEVEAQDARKTADDAPAPVHPERERETIVRDAEGRDPYGRDAYGADGERVDAAVGRRPEEIADPKAAALAQVPTIDEDAAKRREAAAKRVERV